jgi:NAD-dependent DNA ligase
MKMTELSAVPGIGAKTAADLRRSGFSTVEDLAAAQSEQLEAVQGFGPLRAAAVIDAAQALMGASVAESEGALAKPDAVRGEAGGKRKKKDKKKKGKKGKKKDKKGKKKGESKGKKKGKGKGKKKDRKR